MGGFEFLLLIVLSLRICQPQVAKHSRRISEDKPKYVVLFLGSSAKQKFDWCAVNNEATRGFNKQHGGPKYHRERPKNPRSTEDCLMYSGRCDSVRSSSHYIQEELAL